MALRRTCLTTALIAVSLACGSSNGGGAGTTPAAPAASNLVDDFTGGLSGTRWRGGEHTGTLVNGAAVLTESVRAAEPNVSYNNQFFVRPPQGAQVTTLSADMLVASASFTGDSQPRAAIEILFQPPADRILPPNNNTHLLIARIGLADTPNGLFAVRQLFQCLDPVCVTQQQLGSASGNWGAGGLPFSLNVTYTATISYDANNVFTFTIVGGALNASATINAGVAPLPSGVDFGAANFYRARINASVRGNAVGGGDGAIAAQFDNVRVGTGFGAASLLDDFATGSTLDKTRWRSSEDIEQVVGGALNVALTQRDIASMRPLLELRDASASALQADVTVTQYSLTGPGGIRAVVQSSLYNDGFAGTSSDPNRVDSQVGDLLATIGMTGSDVVYGVVRCNTVGCDESSFVKPFTSLGTAALGSTHTLYVNWDAASHQVVFRLDANAPVAFDPVGAGFPVAASAHRPLRRIGAHASSNSATDAFGSASSGSITATFDNVRTN